MRKLFLVESDGHEPCYVVTESRQEVLDNISEMDKKYGTAPDETTTITLIDEFFTSKTRSFVDMIEAIGQSEKAYEREKLYSAQA